MLNKPKIAIIGANVQQTPLIKKAKEMGYETYVFAWQTGDDTGEREADVFIPISAQNKEAIYDTCKDVGVDAVASVGSDISAITAAYVAEKLNLITNTYKSVSNATNKIKTREILTQLGVLQPKYAKISDIIDKEIISDFKYPVVVKPSDRSGGRGLKKVSNEKALYNAINYARDVSFEHKAIIEQYIDGQTYSVECISQNGQHTVLGYTKRNVIEINGSLCENEHSAPANIPLSLTKEINEIAVKVLDGLDIKYGASSIEFIVAQGMVYVNEVTPTMYGDFIGTDILPSAYGYDYLKMVIDIASGNEIDFSVSDSLNTASVHFVYSREEGYSDLPEVPDGTRHGHYICVNKLKEFGGVPPFYLQSGNSYYTEKDDTVNLNSEYTAVWYALNVCGANCVHVPYYASSVYKKAADELGIELKYYRLNREFLPEITDIGEDDAVIIVNYFGLLSDYIRNFDAKIKIVDNTTAFFETPILSDGVYNIYSCRKFFAVADGAYLVSKNIKKISLERDVSHKRAEALLVSAELGESEAYKLQQTNEQELLNKKRKMSVLTEKMMSSQNYDFEKSVRISNFNILHNVLGRYNLLNLDNKNIIPQAYPLLVDADIRNYLVSKKIFVPVMWRKFICEEFDNTIERFFAEKLLCIPIDSHYSTDDMKYIADIIVNLLS